MKIYIPNLMLSGYKFKQFAEVAKNLRAKMNKNNYHWWNYLYNPGGKYLAESDIEDSLYDRYFETPFRVEALLRLIRLQLLIKQHNVSKEDIRLFLSEQPPENQDPYTEKAVQYDRENNYLYVLPFGREEDKIIVFL